MDQHTRTAIFLPTLAEAIQRVDKNGLKLAHYTRFEVAKLIISERAVWMRNARTMNDIGEIDFGIAALDNALIEHEVLLKKALTPISALLPAAVIGRWQHMRAHVVKDVFLSCFSEHWPKEDAYGRLSMWRAYGDPDGVALVLNIEAFRLETNALNAYSSPVFYGEFADFSLKLEQVLENIADNSVALQEAMSPDAILAHLSMALLFGAVCLKHPGFAEEQEWRVIHMPNIPQPSLLRPRNLPGPPPQMVYEIPLEDSPQHGLVGLNPDQLISRVIIGPSGRGEQIADELAMLLQAQGMDNPWSRIVQSGIPLRV